MPSTVPSLHDFVRDLPKCELHVHLEGTLEPGMRVALAARNGLPVPDVSTPYDFDSLTSFLSVYYAAMTVLVQEQDFYDLAMAYVRTARDNGVIRVEAFFDPQAHTSRGVPFASVISGYSRAAADASALGIDVGLIMCFLRDLSAESAMATLAEALPLADLLIGVGLDSDELGNPPEKFRAVFDRARSAGLRVTVHCDVDQQDSITHIRQAAVGIAADRIDHGSNVVEDPALVQILVDRRIALTTCPLSNALVADSMKSREIVELLHAGVNVTVNSDDPAYFGGYIVDNYVALAEDAGLDDAAVVQLARNSFLGSWASEDDKRRYLSAVEEFVATTTA
ncbi:adenosine deaminase [Microbacterium rhizomatis]|uniref:Adenine deaminase n=1 Tax=Microbacterium rhizomatis TaxID=1631477 RepID=A0A5J5J0K1_9MICO|nr:adenosine deaminase [Microbacterium rhizomatis]KAA9107985.1 adenosine deaminase [Microbacterium rhizomatis]